MSILCKITITRANFAEANSADDLFISLTTLSTTSLMFGLASGATSGATSEVSPSMSTAMTRISICLCHINYMKRRHTTIYHLWYMLWYTVYRIRCIQYHSVDMICKSVYNECYRKTKTREINKNHWQVFPITVWIYGNIIGLPVNTFPAIVIILLLLTFIRLKTVRLTWVFILQVEISSKQSIKIFYKCFIDSSRVERARE